VQFEQNNPLAKLAKQLEAQEKVEENPNTLATIGEIQKALSAHRAELEQEFARREAQQQAQQAHALHQLQVKQAQAQDAARFTSALNDTLSHKDLAVVKTVVPNPEIAEAIIRYNVAQMDPQSIEEGIEFMHSFVKQWADNVRGQQKVEDGRAAAAKARAVIEPPNGSPPAPVQAPKPQSFFKKDGGLDWGALHQKALAQMEG
jgi:Fe2+ transport system protein B